MRWGESLGGLVSTTLIVESLVYPPQLSRGDIGFAASGYGPCLDGRTGPGACPLFPSPSGEVKKKKEKEDLRPEPLQRGDDYFDF